MGVSASLKAIHDDDLVRITNDTQLVVPFLFGAQPPPAQQPKPTIFSRLFGRPDAPTPFEPFHDTPSVTLAGHWELMTFALSGPTPPKDNPLDLVGGEYANCTDVDLGYGPPSLIPLSQIVEFNRAMTQLSDSDIGDRLNDKDLSEADIYEKDQILANQGEWRSGLIDKASELRAFGRYCEEARTSALVYFH